MRPGPTHPATPRALRPNPRRRLRAERAELVVGEAAPLDVVVEDRLLDRAAVTALHACLVCEPAQRIPDRRVDPGAAQVDGNPSDIDRVQPAADPVARLQHQAVHAGVGQRIRGRQAGQPAADHDHTLDRALASSGDIKVAVVVGLGGHPEIMSGNGRYRPHGGRDRGGVLAALPRCGWEGRRLHRVGIRRHARDGDPAGPAGQGRPQARHRQPGLRLPARRRANAGGRRPERDHRRRRTAAVRDRDHQRGHPALLTGRRGVCLG